MNVNHAEFANADRAAIAVLKSIRPDDLDWKPFAAFPPAARLAVVLGHPTESGLYVVRVKLPGGAQLMPHRHPENRIYTVMSGTFYIGVGPQFDGGTRRLSAGKRGAAAGKHVAFPLGKIG